MRRFASLVVFGLGACSQAPAAFPPPDASTESYSREASSDAEPDSLDGSAREDVLPLDAIPTDTHQHDAEPPSDVRQDDAQRDATPQSDAAPQVDASPQTDAACGGPGEPCCGGTLCHQWPAPDHSYQCNLATGLCEACGTKSLPCCGYTPRCAAWLSCLWCSYCTPAPLYWCN